MRPAIQRKQPFARLFGRAAAILAFLAQLAVLGAGVAEGRTGLGYGAHVDSGGTAAHYVHDETFCAACQARSLHGVARIPQLPTVALASHESVEAAAPTSFANHDAEFSNLSRAPPAVL
jgi:hypothetical protein